MQQATTWADVDPVLCRHLASLGYESYGSLVHELERTSSPMGSMHFSENTIMPIHSFRMTCWVNKVVMTFANL